MASVQTSIPIARIRGMIGGVRQWRPAVIALHEWRAWRARRYLQPTLAKVRPFTMHSEDRLIALGNLTRFVLTEGIPGEFVECGVWRGGTSFLMADLLRRRGAHGRKVWMCDSFCGPPTPHTLDGERAGAYLADTHRSVYSHAQGSSLSEVLATARALGVARWVEPVAGVFDQTLPAARAHIGPIALLHLDADWYEGTACCLAELFDQVSPGGIVVIDPYYDWSGVARALHEFLGTRGLPYAIMPVVNAAGGNESAFLRKDEGQQHWLPVNVLKQVEM